MLDKSGILVVNKPKGISSFGVVSSMKKILNCKKVGHCGTLDPLATGVLPILLGKATKALQFMPDTKKIYIASFRLGITTDTQDALGKILTRSDFSISRSACEGALSKFIGEILQIPPMYSALKKNGKCLYQFAREGIEILRQPRPIFIYKMKLTDFNEDTGFGKFVTECSSGTYMRTICHDLGQKLGCGAIMTDLIRINSCGFSIKNSITLEKIEESPKNAQNALFELDSLFSIYHKINVSAAQTFRFKCGGALALDRLKIFHGIKNNEILRVYDPEEKFVGLGKILEQEHKLAVLKSF
ncbi:MAG: tRNA pseudouridine(55) synthase TruB [Oscillospiraceae bacterium]|jgi:tRNA pseudouridine55 synthase|nr:tRNA pseudouridine(55) synthase TruB [Oscillospiraceae bacterium]